VALDQLFDAPLPYMMWITQASAKTQYENAWLNIEIVSPWRAQGVQRYIAAAEVSTEEYFNPVDPADIAQRLRALVV
jgi:UDPglucose--hexose-1-phosphate uridylyltransferase